MMRLAEPEELKQTQPEVKAEEKPEEKAEKEKPVTKSKELIQKEKEILEIVSFLNKNKDSRDEAMTIILTYTTTMVNRRLFIDTDVDKQLLRLLEVLIEDEQVTAQVFQCLINFSLDKTWCQRLVDLNVAKLVFEFLMHNVKP